ncbi:hypothetical protein OKW41_004741 [Paraburkholderia sp. UCT70]
MFVTLRGEPYLLWQAVDQHGAELDVLPQKRRDKAAAKRFFKRVLVSCSEVPRKIVTDQLRSYPAAKAEIPELATVKHVFVKASAWVNNRAENSHQPTRERERRMRGFRDPDRTQAFLSSFGLIRQHFAIKRHLLRASLYRKQLPARFEANASDSSRLLPCRQSFNLTAPPGPLSSPSFSDDAFPGFAVQLINPSCERPAPWISQCLQGPRKTVAVAQVMLEGHLLLFRRVLRPRTHIACR